MISENIYNKWNHTDKVKIPTIILHLVKQKLTLLMFILQVVS